MIATPFSVRRRVLVSHPPAKPSADSPALPSVAAFRARDIAHVHLLGWDDWASYVAESVKLRGTPPERTTYVLVAFSAAVPDHRQVLVELLPALDEMSGHQVQWLLVGLRSGGIAPSAWSEIAVTSCLRDLAGAAQWKEVPHGAIAVMTCRLTTDGAYEFDLDAYFALKAESLTPEQLRVLLVDLGQLAPDGDGIVRPTAIRRRLARALTAAELRRAGPLLERLLSEIGARLK